MSPAVNQLEEEKKAFSSVRATAELNIGSKRLPR